MSSQLIWLAISKVCGRPAAPSTRTRAPTIQRRCARKRRGHGERPSSSLRRDVNRRADEEQQDQPGNAQDRARRSAVRAGSAIAVEGDAVELHAVVDEAEAELLGDPLLQHFELLVDELDDIAGFDIDQMIVVRFRRGFVARAAVAELVALEDAGFLEQADRAVDGGDRDIRGRSPRRARGAFRRRDGPRCRRARAR